MAEGDETLRGLYGRRALPSDPHVGDDDWVRLGSGEGPAAERAGLRDHIPRRARLPPGAPPPAARAARLDHVVRCAQCARFYRVLSDLEEGARRFDRDVPPA